MDEKKKCNDIETNRNHPVKKNEPSYGLSPLRFGVLPLNNPPYFPRYNGGMEKSIRDFKAELSHRRQSEPLWPAPLDLAAEVAAQELNHRPRRCLKGRTACAVFHDEALRLRWTQRQRQTIFGLLLKKFGAMLEKTADEHHYRPATLWRVTVEDGTFTCQP